MYTKKTKYSSQNITKNKVFIIFKLKPFLWAGPPSLASVMADSPTL